MSRPRRRPAARGLRARRRREIANVEKLVGTSGMRSLPWHAIYSRQIKDGTALPEILATAERSRREWDARNAERLIKPESEELS
jgi:hypothetical protein